MKKLILLILLLPTFLIGQINESDTLDVKAGLSISGLYQGGNVETLIFRAKTDLSLRTGKNFVFKNQNSYVYQEFGNVKADEDILSLNFLYHYPEKRIYSFSFESISACLCSFLEKLIVIVAVEIWLIGFINCIGPF